VTRTNAAFLHMPYLQAHSFILDPPSIIFIARLHLTSVARRKFAAVAGRGLANGGSSSSSQKQPSRIPPPVELPAWAQSQQAEHLPAIGHSSKSSPITGKGSHGREQGQRRSYDSSGSSSSAAGGSRAGGGSWSSTAAAAAAGSGDRGLDDAPDLLCCPITDQVGVFEWWIGALTSGWVHARVVRTFFYEGN
jgi:hypothetical protein